MTSGIDGLYPPGMVVGTVSRVQRAEKERFAQVELKPAAGLRPEDGPAVLRGRGA